jgi:uroporphyrinogen decarboxylase
MTTLASVRRIARHAEPVPRPGIKDRFYRVYTYQPVDRVPDVEFGYWPQTIRRWLREGLPLELTPDEQNSMFLRKLDDYFGFENEGAWVNLRLHMHPVFEEKIIERKAASVIMRDGSGAVAERYQNDVESSSIPHYIDFPVKTMDDWKSMKERFRLDEPTRAMPAEDLATIRAARDRGEMITTFAVGFYGQMRNWMGMENLSYAFFDQPDMIHDMVEHWAELVALQIERLPADIPVDCMAWWEDMASRNGPLVSPRVFREFLQPGYRRVMQAALRRGCAVSWVDSDGNPHDIVANWMEEGVNTMFPIEVAAGVDPYAWREEFGMELRLKGGIAKTPLVEGGKAIDAELERIRPLFEQGGFIPHLDHLVPPDISLDNYRYYLDRKRKLIGRQ